MAINSKNTKAEILAAYKELEKQKKSLETAAKNSPPANSRNNSTNNKPLPTVQINNNVQRDMLKTIQSLEQIQIGFGGAVSNLSERLIAEATQLTEIRDAIAQETEQLATLHELTEIEEDTIDLLLEEYQENAKKFAEELSKQTETGEQEIQALKLAWTKEKEIHSREIKERNEEYRKTQQREAEEYQYNLDLERDRDEGEYEQEKKLKLKQLEETYPTDSTANQMVVAAKAVEKIEGNPTLKQKAISAVTEGGIAAFEKAIDNPAGAFIAGAVKGWKEAQ